MYNIIRVYMCVHVHVCLHNYNSYQPVIGVHEMHGRIYPNYWHITILLVQCS